MVGNVEIFRMKSADQMAVIHHGLLSHLFFLVSVAGLVSGGLYGLCG